MRSDPKRPLRSTWPVKCRINVGRETVAPGLNVLVVEEDGRALGDEARSHGSWSTRLEEKVTKKGAFCSNNLTMCLEDRDKLGPTSGLLAIPSSALKKGLL